MDDLLSLADNGKRKATESRPTKRATSGSRTIEQMMSDIDAVQQDMPTIVDVPATATPVDPKKACVHHIAFPPSETVPAFDDPVFALPRVENMAKKYAFDLDPFQVKAVSAVDRNESVLVSAHTSAGKTVVAEYAIAQALARNQRLIYTSPIKALSNQKYNDLCGELVGRGLGDGMVGLMTGDTTINKSAPVLVMTTEILRSMLYKGDTVRREVGWVVFDECHYMRDSERGVVWEETIAMLPHQVRYVFLSATIPNAKQFAGWIAHTHHQRCHVIYTEYRPTPLQTYIFSKRTQQGNQREARDVRRGDRGRPRDAVSCHLTRVLSPDGTFNEGEFTRLLDDTDAVTMGGVQEKTRLMINAVRALKKKAMTPAIIFAFNRNEVERWGGELYKAINMHDGSTSEGQDVGRRQAKADAERAIKARYMAAIELLTPEDRRLPVVGPSMLAMLLRGVGVHHSGMLPVMKELVEILFAEGLIKLLVATETFAMGLNMPARTVIFSGVSKFDGVSRRCLTGGEYTQMSGRAGRRGTDTVGHSVIMAAGDADRADLRHMIRGGSDDLNSSFRVSYNMLLNTMRIEGDDPRAMLQASFMQYQRRAALPGLLEEAKAAQARAEAIPPNPAHDAAVRRLALLRASMATQQAVLRAHTPTFRFGTGHATHPMVARLVYIEDGDRLPVRSFGWGLVLHAVADRRLGHELDVLLPVTVDPAATDDTPTRPDPVTPATHPDRVGHAVVKVPAGWVTSMTVLRVSLPPSKANAMDSPAFRKATYEKYVWQIVTGQAGPTKSAPPLGIVGDVTAAHRIADLDFRAGRGSTPAPVQAAITRLAEASGQAVDVGSGAALTAAVQSHTARQAELATVDRVMAELRGALDTVMADDVVHMSAVLGKLGFTTGSDAGPNIEKKGGFACEISSTNEVLLTELVFRGVFRGLGPADTATLLGTLIDEKKGDVEDPPAPTQALGDAVEAARAVAVEVGTVMQQCGVSTDGATLSTAVNLTLAPLVHAWASGRSLADCMALNENMFEGELIRVLRRLDVLLVQVIAGCTATSMVDDDGRAMAEQFEAAQACIHRGVVFMESLWTAAEEEDGSGFRV